MPALQKEFGYKNVMAIPKIEKVVVNMGLGEGDAEREDRRHRRRRTGRITGQKPGDTRAKKSIAQFKVRRDMPIGAMVTLRGDRMWEFLDRLIADRAAARARFPRRVAARASTAAATTRSACSDQLCSRNRLHEGRQGARHEHLGVTTARTDEEARRLLQLMGMPFRTEQ